MVLAANGDAPYKSVADVITAAKAKPGVLNVCTPGYGSINQLVLESIALDTGTNLCTCHTRAAHQRRRRWSPATFRWASLAS